MKIKIKNRIVNILILFLSLVLLGQVAFLLISSLKNSDGLENLAVEASGEYKIFKKEGLLDLIGGEVDLTVKPQVKIENKSDFAEVFNNYFNQLKADGGYRLEGNFIVIGTAETFGITAYQATKNIYEVSQNGEIFAESATIEVPSPSGSITGQGRSVAKRIWVKENGQQSQSTKNISYEQNGKTYIVNPNYDGSSIIDESVNREKTLLPFVVDEKTIDEINIEASNLFYQVEIFLNFEGYKQNAIDAKDQSEAVRLPAYDYFKIKAILDKFGNVVSLSTSQSYDITIKVAGIDMTAKTKTSFEYVIKKKENF